MTRPITTVKESEAYGPTEWEYVGTVDALDTRGKAHPTKHFSTWYYGVPRIRHRDFGTVTWDVWVPRKKTRNGPGYSDKHIAKWQAACPHRFLDDALDVLRRWENDPRREVVPTENPESAMPASNPSRRVVFVCAMHREYGTLGWLQKGRSHYDPYGGMATAHDCLEHLHTRADHPGDAEANTDEFQALGAALYVRGDGGYWAGRGAHQTPGRNVASDLPDILGHIFNDTSPDDLPVAPGTRPLEAHVEEWIDEALSDGLGLCLEQFEWEIEQGRVTKDTIREVLARSRGWFRVGYRRAKERYRALRVRGGASAVCHMFREIEKAADAALEGKDDLGEAMEGDELVVTIDATHGRVSVEHTREGWDVDPDDDWDAHRRNPATEHGDMNITASETQILKEAIRDTISVGALSSERTGRELEMIRGLARRGLLEWSIAVRAYKITDAGRAVLLDAPEENPASEYVKITFLPAGWKRKRTTWAIKMSPGRYMACDVEGEVWFTRDGKDTREMIVVKPEEVTERPARMNMKYAQLEVIE